jgi:hypothetical protein
MVVALGRATLANWRSAVILVKASPGLVIEFGVSEPGKWDALSLRLSEGLSSQPFRFEVRAGDKGRLLVRPLEARSPADLIVALGVIAANEDSILAEVHKYNRAH